MAGSRRSGWVSVRKIATDARIAASRRDREVERSWARHSQFSYCESGSETRSASSSKTIRSRPDFDAVAAAIVLCRNDRTGTSETQSPAPSRWIPDPNRRAASTSVPELAGDRTTQHRTRGTQGLDAARRCATRRTVALAFTRPTARARSRSRMIGRLRGCRTS